MIQRGNIKVEVQPYADINKSNETDRGEQPKVSLAPSAASAFAEEPDKEKVEEA